MNQSKLVIKDIPENIQQILHEIYECINHEQTYERKNKQKVLDWLNEKYGDYLLYEYFDHIAYVIRDRNYFITVTKEQLEDRYNKKLSDIPKVEKCDFFRECFSQAKDDPSSVLGITSVGFECNGESMVLALAIYSAYPQAESELFWLDFFISDSDVIKFIEEKADWINFETKFTNQQILNLLN